MTTRRSTGSTDINSDAPARSATVTLTRRAPPDPSVAVRYNLALTAEERRRTRVRFTAEEGIAVQLALPRGTDLHDRDLLYTEDGATRVRVRARAEPVLTARAPDAPTLLRAAYHLGNRHVPVEVRADCLRLSPDAVLADMLRQLGLEVRAEVAPFQPEAGAYGGHAHGHAHEHA